MRKQKTGGQDIAQAEHATHGSPRKPMTGYDLRNGNKKK